MDVASLATLLLMALVLAAQPWSVLAAIILVTTRGGVLKECAYAIGWIIACPRSCCSPSPSLRWTRPGSPPQLPLR